MSRDEPSRSDREERAASAYLLVVALVPVLIIGGVILVFVFAASPAQMTTNATGPSQARDSGHEMARQTLVRHTDLNSCRTALQQINTEMTEKSALRPPALTEERKTWLCTHIALDEAELAEVESGTYTRLDGVHLENCFLLSDAARALEVKGVRSGGEEVREKPLEQAVRAFAWVVRQVRLRERSGAEVSADFTLRRGWGSSLERALVFLALLEQLGDANGGQPHVTGCLLQVPDQSGQMHLWACGVLVGEDRDIYLFDPRLGLPLPGPKGEGVATLAAVRKDPEILAQLNVSAKHSYDVTTEQARAAQAQLVYPLSALSPRMQHLQDQILAPAVRVRLAVDPAKAFERVTAACAAGAEKPPVVQMPREQVTRQRQFLPVDEGGTDAGTPLRQGDPRRMTRKMRATLDLVPRTYLPAQIRDNPNFPINSVLGERVQELFAGPFIRTTLDAGQSRDLLLRGRYSAAEPQLVTERERWRDQQKARAADADLESKVDKWMDQAVRAYADLLRAGPAERESAELAAKAVWSPNTAAPMYILLFSAVAQIRNPEISYQLGLCSQEQAEQLQARLDGQARAGGTARKGDVEKTRQAWQDALSAWKRYEEDYPRHVDILTIRRLRGRASSMLGDWQAAIAAWKDVENSRSDLDALASLLLARQAEKQHLGKDN